MKAINIKWDTDDQVVDLPSEVEIPEGYFEDDIADYLSDEYGWCVFSFELDTDSEKKRYEIYDINDEVMEHTDDLCDAQDYAENNNAKFVMDIQTNEIVWGSDEEESSEEYMEDDEIRNTDAYKTAYKMLDDYAIGRGDEPMDDWETCHDIMEYANVPQNTVWLAISDWKDANNA